MKNFFALAEKQLKAPIRTIRSDNGSEFLGLTEFFQQQGVIHETSYVNTPQQNGRVERKHRHVFNVARALRFQANLPIEFWGECILTTGYLINRTPSSVLEFQTSYERVYKQKPGYDHLRVLGSLCFAHNQNRAGDKFAERSRRCVFVGYPHGKKGWRLYDLDKLELFVSHNVVFSETQFPYRCSSPSRIKENTTGLWDKISNGLVFEDDMGRKYQNPINCSARPSTEPTGPSTEPTGPQNSSNLDQPTLSSSQTTVEPITNPLVPTPPPTNAFEEVQEPQLGKGQ